VELLGCRGLESCERECGRSGTNDGKETPTRARARIRQAEVRSAGKRRARAADRDPLSMGWPDWPTGRQPASRPRRPGTLASRDPRGPQPHSCLRPTRAGVDECCESRGRCPARNLAFAEELRTGGRSAGLPTRGRTVRRISGPRKTNRCRPEKTLRSQVPGRPDCDLRVSEARNRRDRSPGGRLRGLGLAEAH